MDCKLQADEYRGLYLQHEVRMAGRKLFQARAFRLQNLLLEMKPLAGH